jgi:hypothetical protein
MPEMEGYISYIYRLTFSVKDADVLPNKEVTFYTKYYVHLRIHGQ